MFRFVYNITYNLCLNFNFIKIIFNFYQPVHYKYIIAYVHQSLDSDP